MSELELGDEVTVTGRIKDIHQEWLEPTKYHVGFDNGKKIAFLEGQIKKIQEEGEGIKPFTKSDLKDGMRILLRDGDTHYVCGDVAFRVSGDQYKRRYELSQLDENLNQRDGNPKGDVIRVTDRDGTVVFEREEEKPGIEGISKIKEMARTSGVTLEDLKAFANQEEF